MRRLTSIIAGVLLAGSVYAQDVGDKMPDVSNYQVYAVDVYENENNKGVVMLTYDTKTEKEYQLAFSFCKDKMSEFPYGVYDLESNTLYLDNAPNDGILDEIIKNPTARSVSEDAPPCGEII